MKKALIIILINISAFILLFACFEFYSYRQEYIEYERWIKGINQFWQEKNDPDHKEEVAVSYKPTRMMTLKYMQRDMITVEGDKAAEKRPIIFTGCSIIQGLEIEQNERLPYLISKLTGRTTYNLGLAGTAINWYYKRLKLEGKGVNYHNPEYIIYVFIPDHIRRLFSFETYLNCGNVRYKIENNKLKELSSWYKYIYIFFSVKRFLRNIESKRREKEIENGFTLFNKFIEETKAILDKRYDNPKFILLDYPEKEIRNIFTEEEIKKLEEMGVIYINAEKLVGHRFHNNPDYYCGDKIHPSAKAWEEIAPKLVERLGL